MYSRVQIILGGGGAGRVLGVVRKSPIFVFYCIFMNKLFEVFLWRFMRCPLPNISLPPPAQVHLLFVNISIFCREILEVGNAFTFTTTFDDCILIFNAFLIIYRTKRRLLKILKKEEKYEMVLSYIFCVKTNCIFIRFLCHRWLYTLLLRILNQIQQNWSFSIFYNFIGEKLWLKWCESELGAK
jgi:hypothetical protein